MSSTTDADQRVRQAAQEREVREMTGRARVAQVDRERAMGEAKRDHARVTAMEKTEAAKTEAREALGVASDALRSIGRAEASARQLLGEHQREHKARRDVAQAALDGLLARVAPELDAQAARFGERLCDPARLPSVTEALALADLASRAQQVQQTGEVLRSLVARVGGFSPLSSPEYEEVRRSAGACSEAIRLAGLDAGGHARKLGEARRRLELGGAADANGVTEAAAAVLACAERAQTELQALRELLRPTPPTTTRIPQPRKPVTTKTTTKGPR